MEMESAICAKGGCRDQVLLAGAGAPFRSYRHRAELCTDHTHTPELAQVKGEAVALALLPIQTTLIGPSNLSKSK